MAYSHACHKMCLVVSCSSDFPYPVFDYFRSIANVAIRPIPYPSISEITIPKIDVNFMKVGWAIILVCRL